MYTIRRGVFETNSSSVHSMCICTKDEYDKWMNGELYCNRWYEEFKTKEEVEALYEEYKKGHKDDSIQIDFNDWRFDYSYLTFEEYFDSEYLETFEENYTTPSGDEIICFGKYGYDG